MGTQVIDDNVGIFPVIIWEGTQVKILTYMGKHSSCLYFKAGTVLSNYSARKKTKKKMAPKAGQYFKS